MCKYCVNKGIQLIELYQNTISPDYSAWGKSRYPGGYCKYTPSCSEYTKLALKKNGFFLGCLKGLWRIIRCNPWSKGGIDRP